MVRLGNERLIICFIGIVMLIKIPYKLDRDKKNHNSIQVTLEEFAEILGLKVNFQKSKVCFSKNVNQHTKDFLSE